MTIGRITAGINKAEDAGRKDGQIGFVDALQRAFPATVPAISHVGVTKMLGANAAPVDFGSLPVSRR